MLHQPTPTRISKLTMLLFGLGAGIASLTWASNACADDDDDHKVGRTTIGLDVDFNTLVDTSRDESGGGGALRVGRQLGLILIKLTPELGGSYHAFSGQGDAHLYSGFVGGRLGFGAVIEPSIYGHVGLAHISGFESRTAPLLDAGLAVDLTLLPLIDLGLHAGYNVMLPRENDPAFKFVTLGAQAALVF
ncbi:MAG TPA: hypothetical protein VHB79_05405 [Polyangiaceae bacterium]|nr:hypothetical protein [Polyangiaceae bacterium]